MDKILVGILTSSHPDPFKHQLIEKVVVPGATKLLSKNNYLILLKKSFSLACNGETAFIREMGVKVFTAYSENNKSSLQDFCASDWIIEVGVSVVDKKQTITIIHGVLKLIENEQAQNLCVETIQKKFDFPEFSKNCELPILKSMVLMLKDFPVCIASSCHSNLCKSIIISINDCHPNCKETSNLSAFIIDTTIVCSLLKQIWAASDEKELIVCLSLILEMLSQAKESSLALGAVAQVFPIKSINLNGVFTTDISTLKDPVLLSILEKVVNWLHWPISNTVHLWILLLLHNLSKSGRYNVFAELTDSKIEQIADRLFIPVARSGSFAVFSYFLLAYQHSPKAFHKIIDRIGKLIEVFSKEEPAIMTNFINLVFAMFHQHSGFPDLYEPVINALSEFPQPNSERTKKLLNEYKWITNNSKAKMVKNLTFVNNSRLGKFRSAAGFVGLENLGNICYMNSIVQALFMSNNFLFDIMKKEYDSQSVLGLLQHLFAFLILSKRISFAPEMFLKASKPPWFEAGSQQDCSEFLRYLLDVLHEYSKSRNESSFVENSFFGATETSYQCLNCQSISQKHDSFADLGISFPEHTNSSSHYRTRNRSDSKPTKDLLLEDLFEHYFQKETLEGDNQYFCEKCASLNDATRLVKITNAPNNLIVHLLRFSYNCKSRSRVKISTNVKYPRTLIVPSVNGKEKINNIYSLYATVVHSGVSSDCGHYYTYARRLSSTHLPLSEENVSFKAESHDSEWYLFNDSNVSRSSYDSFGNVTRLFPNDTAYLLFYKKIDEHVHRCNNDIDSIQVPKYLTHLVTEDNNVLRQEKENQETDVNEKSSFFTTKLSSWKDFDEDGNSPRGGGGCGHGNLDLSVSRFVF